MDENTELIKVLLGNAGDLYLGYKYNGTEIQPWGGESEVPSYSIFVSQDGKKYETFNFYGSIRDYEEGKDALSNSELCFAAQCVFSDAHSASENDFEDFKSEFGYEDTAQAIKIYSECTKTASKLQNIGLNNEERTAIYNDLIEIENIGLDEKSVSIVEVSSIPQQSKVTNEIYDPVVISFDWSKVDIESYENLTANAFVGDMDSDLDNLKELLDNVENLKTCVDDKDEGFLQEVSSNCEAIRDNFELIEKYSGSDYSSFVNLVKDSLDEVIDESLQEAEILEKVKTILEVKSTIENHLSDKYNGLDVNGSYPEDCIAEAKESYFPMMNAAWKLEKRPSEDAVKKILEEAPNVSLLTFYESTGHGCQPTDSYITMNGAGMDFSQALAYAYLKVDGKIPQGLMNERNMDDAPFALSQEGMNEIKEYFQKKTNSASEELKATASKYSKEEHGTLGDLVKPDTTLTLQ